MASRNRFCRNVIVLSVSLFLLIFPGIITAQDDAPPPRDTQALAARFLGYAGTALTSPLTPVYAVGDRAEFWVAKTGSANPVRVSAVLVGIAPDVYIWVEEGVTPTGNLRQRAGQFGLILNIYRSRDNFREASVVPGIGTVTDPGDLLPLPDIDNDPHLYLLFTTGLRENGAAIFNPLDSLPVEYAPFSNQHEMLYVDTTPYPATELADPLYAGLIIRALHRWIAAINFPQQPLWLTEALDWSLLFTLQEIPVPPENLTAYLAEPDTALLQPPDDTTFSQAIGGQQLLLAYFQQRYGSAPFLDLFAQTGSGITPFDAVLENRTILDPATGALVTGRDAFADFVLTNAVNVPFGDGRYVQTLLPLPDGQTSNGSSLTPPLELAALSVNQFGAQVYGLSSTNGGSVEISFTGSPTVPRLTMPLDRDPADSFYWSGQGVDQNPTLTRAVDLTSVDSATLTFDAWYDFAPAWNYGYVSASTDDGATWQPLAATNTTAENPYGIAYGVGFTGISNTAGPRPFPIMGVLMSGDGVTISEVTPTGAAAAAGVRAQDVIVGYDSHEWQTLPDVIGLLANYAPGDTLHLYIQRGGERLDLPVLLGAHPTRIVEPSPIWLPQSVDLSAYAGQPILLRFETVTLPGRADRGFAVDNLAIPEIDWSDSADSSASGWDMHGWAQLDNTLRQQWIVQAITGGTQTVLPRVRRLIDAHDDLSTGSWRFTLGAGETLLLTVSGVNDDTTARASYSLDVK